LAASLVVFAAANIMRVEIRPACRAPDVIDLSTATSISSLTKDRPDPAGGDEKPEEIKCE
jgi:hypothetical protein